MWLLPLELQEFSKEENSSGTQMGDEVEIWRTCYAQFDWEKYSNRELWYLTLFLFHKGGMQSQWRLNLKSPSAIELLSKSGVADIDLLGQRFPANLFLFNLCSPSLYYKLPQM